MTLAAAAPTTDGRENPATDTSRIAPYQDRKTFKSSTLTRYRDGFPKIANTLEAAQPATGAESPCLKTEQGRSVC